MKNETFPSLPFGLNPTVVVKHGSWYYAYIQDGKYKLRFDWDGLSHTFNSVDIQIDWDEVKDYNKQNETSKAWVSN